MNHLLQSQRMHAPAARIRSAALVAALSLLALSACSLVDDPATETASNAGVGADAIGVGDLELRNVLIVANEQGEGHLVAAIVNGSADDVTLEVSVEADSATELAIDVPAEATLSFGEQEGLEEPPLIDGLVADPGAMVEMTFAVGDDAVSRQVPVLDGCLSYLEGLEPDVPADEECAAHPEL